MTRVTAAGFSGDVPSTGLGDGKRVAPVRREGALGTVPRVCPSGGARVHPLPHRKGPGAGSDCGPGWVGPAPCPLHGEAEAVGTVRAAHGKGLAPSGTFQ